MSEVIKAEKRVEALKAQVKFRDDLFALIDHPLYQKIIEQGFCTDNAARAVRESTNPLFNQAQKDDSLGMAQAAGFLRRWVSATVTMANQAEDDLADSENLLRYLKAGGNYADYQADPIEE